MAVATITFNNSSGSDTAASGAGPSTALSGANGATTNASPSVNLSVDAPNLSGVAVDSSALMWVDTTTGRQYSAITAVDNVTKIVTCADNYGVTAGTRAWGIGGKRKTLDHADSRTLFADGKPGQTVVLEDNQSIATVISPVIGGDVTSGTFKIRSSVAGTRRTITQTANAGHFSFANAANVLWTFTDIVFACSNGTKTSANAIVVTGSTNAGRGFTFLRCGTDSTNAVQRFFSRTTTADPYVILLECYIWFCTSSPIDSQGTNQTWVIINCLFYFNGGAVLITNAHSIFAVNNIFADHTGNGLGLAGTTWTLYTPKIVIGNTFYSNSSAGLLCNADVEQSTGLVVANNIFNDNGTGVSANALTDSLIALNANNDYEGNSTDRTNLSVGTDDLALDPQFTNVGALDWSIGTNLKAEGWPFSIGGTNETLTYVDIGAAQREEAASAAGGIGSQIFGG
jgi:hypothetical protein